MQFSKSISILVVFALFSAMTSSTVFAALADIATEESQWQVEFPQPTVREVEIDEDWFDFGVLSLTVRLSSAPPAPVRVMTHIVNGDDWYFRSRETVWLSDTRPHKIHLNITPLSNDWLPAGHMRTWDGYLTWKIKTLGLKAFCEKKWKGSIRVENVELQERKLSRSTLDARNRIVGFSTSSSPAQVGQVFEVSFRFQDGHRNPFDPEEADVQAVFLAPSGKQESVPAFFYQNYVDRPQLGDRKLVPVGPAVWKVRYCPEEQGTYKYYVTVDGRWKLSSARQQIETIAPEAPKSVTSFQPTEKDLREFLYPAESHPTGQRYELRDGVWAYNPDTPSPDASPAWRTSIEWTDKWGGFHGPGRYNLEQAWEMDLTIRNGEAAGISFPLVFADREELYEQRKYNWLSNPLNQELGGSLQTPHDYFSTPDTSRLVALRGRYSVARWGASPAVSRFVMRNDVPAERGVDWCAEVASLLGEGPPPLKPLLSAHPQSMPIVERRVLSDFEKDTIAWSAETRISPLSKVASPRSGQCDGALTASTVFPGELALSTVLDESIWGHDVLAFDLHVPEGAPNYLRPMIYLYDGDWWWYEALLDPLVRPGDWTKFTVDLSDKSKRWKPRGHARPWNTYLLGRIQRIGVRVFGFGESKYTGPICIDNVELWKTGRQAFLDKQQLSITRISANADQVSRYSKFEVTFNLSKTYNNPFDPREADIVAEFISPSGNIQTIPAFFYMGYNREKRTNPKTKKEEEHLLPEGSPCWKLRFTPTEIGVYDYVIRVRGSNKLDGKKHSFTSVDSDDPGFVRISKKDPLYFEFDNGDFYYPFGHNVRSPSDSRKPYPYDFTFNKDLGTYLYDEYFARMAEAGENWSRVWMATWWCGLEWRKDWYGYHGIGRYNVENAWRLDYIMDLAEKHNLYLQVVTMNHGQLSTKIDKDWHNNPMNVQNGGFLDIKKSHSFYSNPKARELVKQRLRYTVARWGYSKNLLAWELSSENEFTYEYWPLAERMKDGQDIVPPQIVKWHADMANYVRQIDPWGHIVSTHYAHPWRGAAIWRLPEIDFVQTNAYTAFRELGYFRSGLAKVVDNFYYQRTRPFNKPSLVAEYGWQWNNAPSDNLDAELHNGPWIMYTTPLSGSVGFWWWLHIHFQDRYQHYRAFANYIEGEDRRGLNLVQSRCSVKSKENSLSARGLQNDQMAYVWVFYGLYRKQGRVYRGVSQPTLKNIPLVSGAGLTIPGLKDGTYNVEFWDTYEGVITDEQEIVFSDGVLQIDLPPVQNDLALKVKLKQ